MSIREIAAEIDTSPATVQRDAACITKQWRDEYVRDADDHIRRDLKRIDTALRSIWGDVEAGVLPAIDRMIRLLDQRAKYLGLYAPAKVQGEFSVTYLDQVREEDAVIAEYAEIIEDVIQRETSQSNTKTTLAPKTLPVGRGQD